MRLNRILLVTCTVVPIDSGTPGGSGVGPGSASGGTAPGTPSSVRNDLAAGGSTGDPGSPSTFEDKRRENFNKVLSWNNR